MFLFFAAFLSFGGVVTHSKLVTHCWLLVRYQQPQYIYTYIYNLYTTCMYLDYFECLRKRTLAVCCLAGCLKLHSSNLFFLVFIYSCGKPLKCGISCVASASQRKHGKALSYCFLFCQTAKFDCLQSIHYNRRTAISNAC